MTARKRLPRLAVAVALALCTLVSCSSPAKEGRPSSGLANMPVSFPDGTTIRAEVALNVLDQARGLMFRDKLPTDAGMLFVFMEEAQRAFWMYHTRIPLDIIWMDSEHRIVEISANTPPCPGEVRDACPNYGGTVPAQFVLEIGSGQAAAHGLKIGDRLNF